MPSNYPGSLDNFSTAHQDAVHEPIHAADINNNSDAINKIEAALGTNPAGALAATVKDRISVLDNPVVNNQSGTSYTLAITDSFGVVGMSNPVVNTVTVPPNSSVAFPIGTRIWIRQVGAGQTSIAPGSGVSINSLGG